MTEEQDEQYDEVHDYSVPIELPSCELSKLDEISELFHTVLSSNSEQLATAIEQEEYIKKLLDIFHMCEDLENTEGLHTLFEIFKSLFMLEKNSLFEVMFAPENLMDVVGILEYDPSKKEPIQHRQFLKEKVKFKEAIPISNMELVQKIHQTYQIQYIKDVLIPVPSLFDENMSTINSVLFFNKIQIVNLIQVSEVCLLIYLCAKITVLRGLARPTKNNWPAMFLNLPRMLPTTSIQSFTIK